MRMPKYFLYELSYKKLISFGATVDAKSLILYNKELIYTIKYIVKVATKQIKFSEHQSYYVYLIMVVRKEVNSNVIRIVIRNMNGRRLI